MYKVTAKYIDGYLNIALPKEIVEQFELHNKERLFLSSEGEKIILSKKPQISIEDLLTGSSKKDFELNDEDRLWLS